MPDTSRKSPIVTYLLTYPTCISHPHWE